jgi:hypothetical protein
MGWERRARGGRYYTRSRREGGRVVREYVGSGRVAELIASLDAAERSQRLEVAQLAEVERQRLQRIDAPIGALCDLVDALVNDALTAAGYHRHDRGEWRKRPGGEEQTD